MAFISAWILHPAAIETDSSGPIWDIPFPIQRAKLRMMETWPTGFKCFMGS